jgi:hypothetical protein
MIAKEKAMIHQTQGTETAADEHAGPARKRRRFAVRAGVLLTGAALVLGTAGVADAKPRPSLPHEVNLVDNCGTGFTGHLSWKDGRSLDTITVTFTPSGDYVGGTAGVDVRGTTTQPDASGRLRTKTVRLKKDYDPTPSGLQTATFTAPANVEIWRAGVVATTPADPLTSVHALDGEAGICA